MSMSLHFEISKFNRCVRQLRNIFRETKVAFNEIESDDEYSTSKKGSLLSEDDENTLRQILEKPVCLIIIGQTRFAKAVVVNELFQQSILPFDIENDNIANGWRMIRFKFGKKASLSLRLPEADFEVMEKLSAYDQPDWKTVPSEDLILNESEKADPANSAAVMEVSLNHSLLKDNVRVVVTPCRHHQDIEEVYKRATEDVLPIVIYALQQDRLNANDIEELQEHRRLAPLQPVFFVRVPPDVSAYKTYRNNKAASDGRVPGETQFVRHCVTLFQDLCQLGFVSFTPREPMTAKRLAQIDLANYNVDSEVAEHFDTGFPKVLVFVRRVLQNYLIRASTILNRNHTSCLQGFIMTAFDLARDILMTPKRLNFVRLKEAELFGALMRVAQSNQDKVRLLISETLVNMREQLMEAAEKCDFIGVSALECDKHLSLRELKLCTAQIRELVLKQLNEAISSRLEREINELRENYTGTLSRCVESLDTGGDSSSLSHSFQAAQMKNGALNDSRESTDSGDIDDNSVTSSTVLLSAGATDASATAALQRVLRSAYQVNITLKTGSSFVYALLEKMKELLTSMSWWNTPQVDVQWRRRVASDMLDSLSDVRLARHLCEQICERLRLAHENFNASLRRLESRIQTRTAQFEDQRDRIRRLHAPRLARLALESVSIRDMILFGMPQLGREIGRGQYGVVYACESWAGHAPIAIKSVVPPDDKHWNDLALEFYYTKNLPEHDRIVVLRGSVIDYTYGGGGGGSPAVLLLMDRLSRDLYTAIKQNLNFAGRLQVAADVIEGIRYLHSQGLVHRDIKLKNVLLDRRNRGKLTDLGFCKPSAMMSGSVVGTPIHMAPELFSGHYDASVDVYAFGILFWYICSGNTRLPYNFEQCNSKDILWSSVKKGVRPERLPTFEQDCWDLMTACWEGSPHRRPLPGNIEPILLTMRQRYCSAAPNENELCSSSTMPEEEAAEDCQLAADGNAVPRSDTLVNAVDTDV